MIGPLVLAALLIFANGFFVAAEFALVKVRASQLDVAISAGHRTARTARGLVDKLDGYLSATQLGITLASLALGWVGEPTVAAILVPLFHQLGISEDLAHKLAFAIGFTIISFLHIVVGEVAPKSLAIARPVGTAMFIATPMRAFYIVFYPALVILNASSNLLLRLVGIDMADTHQLAVPAEELRRIAEDSAAVGQITKGQGDLLSNVFTFSSRVAREIMVPRNKVLGLDLRLPREEVLKFALEADHTRYPVFDGDLDEIVGILHIKDVLVHIGDGAEIPDLRTLVRPPLFVPESMPAQRLLRTFQRQHTHLAVVLDEYGGVAGITTLEDALEELVGEIQDEYDEERNPVEETASGYSVVGGMLLADVESLLSLSEIESESSTIAGYLMEQLERVPKVGDQVELDGWTIRVTQVERRAVERVELVRATPVVGTA
ncbi:MAG: HlyC/CorC family transporter [Deltaproteobacteria bacterium]|nr:HlyC/CorC family transporter [Deltaproteobacteria bacterium]